MRFNLLECKKIMHTVRCQEMSENSFCPLIPPYPYLHYIIIVEKPEAMALNDGDVVASVGATAAVNYHCYQVIHTISVLSIIRLQTKTDKYVNIECEVILLNWQGMRHRLTVLNNLSSQGKTTRWLSLVNLLNCSTYLNLLRCKAKI